MGPCHCKLTKLFIASYRGLCCLESPHCPAKRQMPATKKMWWSAQVCVFCCIRAFHQALSTLEA